MGLGSKRETARAAAAILYKDEKIFVTRHGFGENEGMWEFPGAMMELGKNPENVLIDKMKKKWAVDIQVDEWMGTVDYEYPFYHLILRIYLCSIVSGDIELDGQNTEKWITIEEEKDLEWTPVVHKFLSDLKFSIDLSWAVKYEWPKNKCKGDYYAYVSDDSKTLPLMDKFEGRSKDSEGPYKRFILKNTYEAAVGPYICQYHPIIERLADIEHTEGNITFSEFKKEKEANVYHYCNTKLNEAFRHNKDILNRKEIYFFTPYYLRAQSSKNREGYGWEWEWSHGRESHTEGTFYGETDNYGFVGVVIENVTRKKKQAQKTKERPENLRVEFVRHMGKKYYKIYKSEEESYLIPYEKKMTKQDVLQIYMSYMS